MKIRHILLTTDLSQEALRPSDAIIELAGTLDARLSLLHVVQDLHVAPHGAPLAPPISSPDIPREIEEARKELTDRVAKMELACDVDVVSGDDIAKTIVGYAKGHDVDLIALSTHGRTGFKRLALGSVAEGVLRHSPIPVMSFHRTE